MAKLLSGKEVAAALAEELKQRVSALAARGVTPRLAVLRVGERADDLSYERGIKKRAETLGVLAETTVFPDTVSADELIAGIERMNADPAVHGILLFRPLPGELKREEARIVAHISPEKDVDGGTEPSLAGVFTGTQAGWCPCTPEACMAVLAHYGIDPAGKKAVVIGRSTVVGKPLAMLLLEKNATVTVCHSKTPDLAAVARGADILVSAAGKAGLVTKDFVSEGQVLLDVSVNWDAAENKLCGDAVFNEVEPVVAAVTPVPGGIGAVTNTILLSHVIKSAERMG
ncbi:MAG: tetrahydrofolate dehydrogenase/cyclohydrolase catalytic domain-containing protein [Clostridia bacterium]|nr:tetrahydrofolate dehydrogenase/cyclohydrolase catalytic domain-containing protein [Clostridia bacterium]